MASIVGRIGIGCSAAARGFDGVSICPANCGREVVAAPQKGARVVERTAEGAKAGEFIFGWGGCVGERRELEEGRVGRWEVIY